MARDHKQRQTRLSHGLTKPRNPRLCQICGHVVFKIEHDHPFRRENDPDFTIDICPACHFDVTAWDARIDRHINRETLTAAPFLYILHRVQLALIRHGITSQTIDLQNMENYILGNINRRVYSIRKSTKFADQDNDYLVLTANIAAWAKRAAELTIPRFSEDHSLVSVLADIANDPKQFYEQLLVYLATPDSESLSNRAKTLMLLIQNNASTVEIHDKWQDFSQTFTGVISAGILK
jgi:hypothetical protein